MTEAAYDEMRAPAPASLADWLGRRGKWLIILPPLLFLLQQVSFNQDPDMLRNGLPAGLEMLGHGARGQRPRGQEHDDGAPGRIGDGLENVPSHPAPNGHYATVR